jgi:hypothetical protein
MGREDEVTRFREKGMRMDTGGHREVTETCDTYG